MTLYTPTLYTPHHLPLHPAQARTSTDTTATLVMEITTPGGHPHAPALPGWTLRAWPVARLGDATLEARPLHPHLGPDDLRAALHDAGYGVLGPIRTRHTV